MGKKEKEVTWPIKPESYRRLFGLNSMERKSTACRQKYRGYQLQINPERRLPGLFMAKIQQETVTNLANVLQQNENRPRLATRRFPCMICAVLLRYIALSVLIPQAKQKFLQGIAGRKKFPKG